jgi:hypothetical protein
MPMFEYTAEERHQRADPEGDDGRPHQGRGHRVIRKNRMILVSARVAPAQVKLPSLRKGVSTRTWSSSRGSSPR